MTELKTLKDLEFDILDDLLGTVSIVNSDQLRQETIKWIKDMRKQTEGRPHSNPFTTKVSKNAIIIFKEFFNISEEDIEDVNK